MEIALVPSPVDNDEEKLRQKHVQERLGYLLTGEKIEKTNKQTNKQKHSVPKFWRATGQSNLTDRMEDCSKVQSWEYVNQTLQAFVAGSHLYTKFDCSVAVQNFSLVATAHDCEIGL